MIDYAVTLMANPMKPEEAPKAYAFLQSRATLDIEEIADHMVSHGCQYDRGDIVAILVKLVGCTKELMLDGYRVQLGDLGNLYLTCRSEGAKSKDSFSCENIKEIRVNFTASKQFGDMAQHASLHRVPTRKAVAAALAAETAGQTSANWSTTD